MTTNRIWIVLIVVAVALVMALPAGAKGPPDGKGPKDPGDDPNTIGGFTCVDAGDSTAAPMTDDFVIELGGKRTGLPNYVCVDVLTTEAGRWNITVTGAGARGLALIPRDSVAPGDSCGGVGARGEEHIYGQFTLPLDVPEELRTEIPAATVNACGTEFAEWVAEPAPTGATLWDATAICDAVDAEVPCGVEVPLEGHPHPLILQARYAGRNNGTATICVDLPPHDVGSPCG